VGRGGLSDGPRGRRYVLRRLRTDLRVRPCIFCGASLARGRDGRRVLWLEPVRHPRVWRSWGACPALYEPTRSTAALSSRRSARRFAGKRAFGSLSCHPFTQTQRLRRTSQAHPQRGVLPGARPRLTPWPSCASCSLPRNSATRRCASPGPRSAHAAAMAASIPGKGVSVRHVPDEYKGLLLRHCRSYAAPIRRGVTHNSVIVNTDELPVARPQCGTDLRLICDQLEVAFWKSHSGSGPSL
jgi:hypothetical protein